MTALFALLERAARRAPEQSDAPGAVEDAHRGASAIGVESGPDRAGEPGVVGARAGIGGGAVDDLDRRPATAAGQGGDIAGGDLDDRRGRRHPHARHPGPARPLGREDRRIRGRRPLVDIGLGVRVEDDDAAEVADAGEDRTPGPDDDGPARGGRRPLLGRHHDRHAGTAETADKDLGVSVLGDEDEQVPPTEHIRDRGDDAEAGLSRSGAHHVDPKGHGIAEETGDRPEDLWGRQWLEIARARRSRPDGDRRDDPVGRGRPEERPERARIATRGEPGELDEITIGPERDEPVDGEDRRLGRLDDGPEHPSADPAAGEPHRDDGPDRWGLGAVGDGVDEGAVDPGEIREDVDERPGDRRRAQGVGGVNSATATSKTASAAARLVVMADVRGGRPGGRG